MSALWPGALLVVAGLLLVALGATQRRVALGSPWLAGWRLAATCTAFVVAVGLVASLAGAGRS